MVQRWMRLHIGVAGVFGLASAVLVGFSSCAPPRDGTPRIEVSPGAAQRVGLIASRSGKPSPTKRALARIHPLAAGQELGGAGASARPGDWVLENDEVVFVIDALDGGGGFAESGGNIVDAADARVRKDELRQLFTYFGAFPRQAVYTKLEARAERDGSVVLVARGRELVDDKIAVVTEYRLGATDRALLLRTTLENTGAAAVTGLGLGDVIQWGAAEKFAPGQAMGFKGKSKGAYIGALGRHASYAITSTEGEIAAISGGAWTDTEQRTNVTLEPRGRVTYERVFLVGERPDAASVVSELTKAAGGAVGTVEVSLVDESDKTVRAASGSKVVIGTGGNDDVLSIVATEAGDRFGGELPPGRWMVGYAESAGRRGDGRRIPLVVTAGKVSHVKLRVSPAAPVKVGPCTESSPVGDREARSRPVPCRVTVEGLDGAKVADLGPAHVAGPAKDRITLGPGESLAVPLSPGRYRFTASRGPEYALVPRVVDVPRDTETGVFELLRVVDTKDYLAADFHQHTILSSDSAVATRDRVLANAAEGLEIAVASEHNVVADLQPLVRELGLASFLVEIAGDELTTDAVKRPWGHANVYPLEVKPNAPNGGAFVIRERTPRDLFAEARALGGARVIQINHPRMGKIGYFDQLGFDPKTASASSPDYSDDFDALEIWNGRRDVGSREKVIVDFLALLRTGHPVTPVGNTDTHGIVGDEPGYPRTYVRVPNDGGLDGWSTSRTGDLVHALREVRDVVLTNGAFLRVSANGVGIGAVARPARGVVNVTVKVSAIPVVEIDTLELRTASGQTMTATPRVTRAGESEARFALRAQRDDAFVILARGSKPMAPLLSGEGEITPWAMSGAIWVDADGDGKSLGRSGR